MNLPEQLQKAIDEKTSMNIAGDLNEYAKFQMAKSIPLAAQNEGGLAGLGASMVMGINMANNMQTAMTQKQEPQDSSKQGSGYTDYSKFTADELEEKLIRVKRLFEQSLISKEEYEVLTEKIKSVLISKII